MKGLFLDADAEMALVFERVLREDDPPITVNLQTRIASEQLPELTAGYDFLLDDHSALPTASLQGCVGLKHVIFLGTGARSYMDPDALAAIGITVHTIKGYGDIAVAEHSIALMWAAARKLAVMDAEIRAGAWKPRSGMQLSGKTIGLVGFGAIAAEVARIAGGSGMRVLAWNRTPKAAAGVEFLPLEAVLAKSDVVSVHLLLSDATRGFLGEEKLALMRPGAILVNTARGAVVDEGALLAALSSGRIGHAALDVFDTEPLPHSHALAGLANVTLSAHSGFYTPEANETLLRRALDIARMISA
jgi:D-3-phosphoglycerate dehydrogenase